MKALSKLVLLLLLVIAPALWTFADARAAESCHKINAKGVGQDYGNGTTTATISGGGLLHGTTYGDFLGSPTITFTTNRATLTVALVPSSIQMYFNSAGEFIFIADGEVTDATGKLAGASGDLHFDAVEDMTTGRFVETVTGNVCVNLAR